MNLKTLVVFLAVVAGPLALAASTETDRKIESAAKASYNYRTVLEDRVKVKVHEGVVTLSGVVHDEAEKALAQATVEDLPGVASVRNEIMIKPAYPERSDAWIAFKIRSRLLVKRNVSAGATVVTVQDGVVTLRGTAENAAQKELAGIYAKEIEGVKAVKNEIVVKPKARMSETLQEKIDDASITTQVKLALLSHKSTRALKTKVVTTDGVVLITGEAASEAEKSLVTKLAQDIRGVVAVKNNMTVKP